MNEPLKEPIQRRTWEEFRATGMLFFINLILHAVGWCIVAEIEDGKVIGCYPARTKYRGFDEKSTDEGHRKIAKYLAEEAPNFPEDIKDEEPPKPTDGGSTMEDFDKKD